MDLVPDAPSNIVCVAAKTPHLPRVPFAVPTSGDHRSPPELSSFWIQRYFSQFEITETLSRSAVDGVDESDGFHGEDARIIFAKGYRKVLSEVYPPSKDWFGAV